MSEMPEPTYALQEAGQATDGYIRAAEDLRRHLLSKDRKLPPVLAFKVKKLTEAAQVLAKAAMKALEED